MAAHCGLGSKVVAEYAEALVGEGVDQPSDLADLDDGDWPSSIKTLHLKKIKAAVAKGDFDVPATFDLLLAAVAVARRPARPPWTHAEDAKLQDAVAQVSRPLYAPCTAYTPPTPSLPPMAQNGHNWVHVAGMLPGRSDNAARNRWKRISPASATSGMRATAYKCSTCGELKVTLRRITASAEKSAAYWRDVY